MNECMTHEFQHDTNACMHKAMLNIHFICLFPNECSTLRMHNYLECIALIGEMCNTSSSIIHVNSYSVKRFIRIFPSCDVAA